MAIIKRRNSDEAAEIQTEEAASQLEGNENPESTESDEAKNPPKVRRRRIVKKTAEQESVVPDNSEESSSEPQENDSATSESLSEPQTQSHHESSESNSDSAHEEHYVPRQRYDNRRWNGNNRYGNRRYNNNRYNNTNYEKNLQARLEAVQAAQKIENPEEYESKPRLLINDLTKKVCRNLENSAFSTEFLLMKWLL